MSDRNYNPRYLNAILQAVNWGQVQCNPSRVLHVTILHDDWCSILNGGNFCDCDPEIGPPKPKGAGE